MEIKIIKTTSPKEKPPVDSLGFGKYFTDHMFIMDYTEGKGWHDARIVPYGPAFRLTRPAWFCITDRRFLRA